MCLIRNILASFHPYKVFLSKPHISKYFRNSEYVRKEKLHHFLGKDSNNYID